MQAENFESYSLKKADYLGLDLAAVCGQLFDFLSYDDLMAFTKAIYYVVLHTASFLFSLKSPSVVITTEAVKAA